MATEGLGLDWEQLRAQSEYWAASIATQQAQIELDRWRAQNIDLPMSQAQIRAIEADIYNQAWNRSFQEATQRFSQMTGLAELTGFIDYGMMNPSTSINPTDSALDYIWSKRPDLKAFYAAQGWNTEGATNQREIVKNWLGMTTDEGVRGVSGDPTAFAQSLGWTAPAQSAPSGANGQNPTLAYQQWYANTFGKQYNTGGPGGSGGQDTFDREKWNAQQTGYLNGNPTMERETFYSNLLAGLSGPSNWAKYQAALRGIQDNGDVGANQLALLGAPQGRSGFGAIRDPGKSYEQLLAEWMKNRGRGSSTSGLSWMNEMPQA